MVVELRPMTDNLRITWILDNDALWVDLYAPGSLVGHIMKEKTGDSHHSIGRASRAQEEGGGSISLAVRGRWGEWSGDTP